MKKLPFFNFQITNQANERLDVFVDGTIVDAETQEIYREWMNDQTSVSFKSFRQQILDSGIKNISITINSRGGQIFDASAMHDFIQDLENNQGYTIETIGIGMICSAATYILSASKNSKISKNAYYMIHNVSGGIWGDVNEVERYANQLRTFNNNIRDFYVNLTGKTPEEIENWMNAETWFYGQQAVDNGFVKSLTSEANPTNPINKSEWNFKNIDPLNVYNSLVTNPPQPDNNFNNNIDMKNLGTLLGNAINSALANFNITPKNAGENQFSAETITNAVTEALKEFKPEIDQEQITNAVNTFFKDGLPQNMIDQISNAVKPVESTPFNLTEDEGYKDVVNRMEEIENKILNGVGKSNPPKEDNALEGITIEK